MAEKIYPNQRVIVNSPYYFNRPATVVCRSLGNAGEWMVALEPDGDLDFVAEAEMQPAEVGEGEAVGVGK